MTTKVDMVSVVIPTLNEAGNIREALTQKKSSLLTVTLLMEQ
jgi:hypothetical protein